MNTGTGNTHPYRRIRWQNSAFFSRGSLWLADDHVLQITSSGVRERYRRFYFRDIKALMLGDAHSRSVGAAIAGLFSFIFGLPVLLSFLSPALVRSGGVVAAWVFFLISLGSLAFFLWRGRTVRLYAVTELQTVLWRPVARRWQAEKLLGQLTPLINAAQAGLVRAAPTVEEQVAAAIDAAVGQAAQDARPPAESQSRQNPGGSAGAA